MPSQLFLISLIVQSTATLFLFLVFVILYRHSRHYYFAYWRAGWFSLGVGLLALLLYFVRPDWRLEWPLLAIYHVSLGATALLALFARFAFLHGRQVQGAYWLLFAPLFAYLAYGAAALPESDLFAKLPLHLMLAVALWASGALFWRIAQRDRKPGASLLALSFALWGLQHVHYGTAFLFLPAETPADALHQEWTGFVETTLVTFVALGMILFVLQEDRSRLLESTRKLEISQQQLKELAMRDPLTGLFNRRHFDQVAPHLEAQARRLDVRIAVFVIDLNQFKETNDLAGHSRGDQILREFAEFLRRETRTSDLTFRWGGDEFLILMMDLSAESAELKAEQLRDRWHEASGELQTEVTLAVGWAFLETDGLEAAIRRADRRMYGDKRGRRNPGVGVSE